MATLYTSNVRRYGVHAYIYYIYILYVYIRVCMYPMPGEYRFHPLFLVPVPVHVRYHRVIHMYGNRPNITVYQYNYMYIII